MSFLRSLLILSVATVATQGVQAFVAPSHRAIESPSATQLHVWGKPPGVGGFDGALGPRGVGNQVKVRKAGGFSLAGVISNKPTAAKKLAAAASAPVVPTSRKSKGIVRGFSKQWNPTVPKVEDPNKIKRGFSKQWNPR